VIGVREDAALEPSFWAQFPGNTQFIPRKALISSANFAGPASFHSHPVGRASGNHWGPAVTLLETTAASPYYFNFHKGDLGNFLVIGPSGAGKTVVLNFLLAQSERFQPKVVFFDKDRGAEIFLRAMGENMILSARVCGPDSIHSSCRTRPPIGASCINGRPSWSPRTAKF
jgi:type IV secretion system protein VirB4